MWTSNGSGIVDIGKAVNILLCRAPASRAVKEHEAGIALVNSEFNFTEYTKDRHRGCNFAKHSFDFI